MSSSRLPGKVLLPLAGRPVIHHIVDRSKSCKKVGKTIVATSNETSDDLLAEYCQENKIECYRGSLENVLSRYVNILNTYNYDYCVRITGDCPLIHPPFIDAQIEALNKFKGDLLWTKKQSRVLEGQGVISNKAIFHVHSKSTNPDDLEHVGSKYFLTKPEEFKYVELVIPEKYYLYNYRLTLDENKDYEFLKNIFNQSWNEAPISLDEVLIWLKNTEKTELINYNVQHSDINKELILKRLKFIPELIGSFSWGDS